MVQAGPKYETKDVTLASGHRLRYYEWPGAGPAIVLLHSSSGYGLMYEWAADQMGDRFHIFAPDQRGHGDSDRPDGEYSAEEYAQDVHEFIQALGLGSAIVGGQSLGGRVSQAFAAMYPDECQGMMLVGGLHLSNFYHDRDTVAGVMKSACDMFNSQTEFASREEAAEFIKSRGSRETEASLNHRLDHNMRPQGQGLAVKYDKIRVAQGLTHMADDLKAYAAKVTCPVVILRCTSGGELTPELAAEFAKLWHSCSVMDIEAGYPPHIHNPAGTAQAIADWVRNVVKA